LNLMTMKIFRRSSLQSEGTIRNHVVKMQHPVKLKKDFMLGKTIRHWYLRSICSRSQEAEAIASLLYYLGNILMLSIN
jgi:hypothetical protein